MVVGPLYLAAGVLQGLLRDGFSFARHPLSVLANGSLGWIQAANFVISGALVIAAATGLRRVLGHGSRGLTWCLSGYGAAMSAAAIFTADPVDGFPPGTPLGMPTSVSTTGWLHFVSGAMAFLCLALSGFFGALTFRRRHMASLAALSLVSGLVVFFGFFGGIVLGVIGIWAAVVIGWAWLSIVSMTLSWSLISRRT